MADINVIVLPDGTEYPVSDYYLPVAISNPTDGQTLKYDATNGVWYNGDDAEGSSVFYGTSAPTSQLGVNGNLYVKYTEGTGGASDTVDALYVKLDGSWCQISTGGGGGTSDYNDLTNKPQINSVELLGNKSLDDLGIQPSEISKTATGSIITFSDGGDNIPVESFECEIVAQQASGTPTPDNPLSITGFSQADITNKGKNLLENEATSGTVGTITFTVNADKSITVNGSTTTQRLFRVHTDFSYNDDLIITGVPSGSGLSLNVVGLGSDTGSGFAFNGATARNIQIVVPANSTFDNVTVYPMVRLASDTDNTYEPYTGNTYLVEFGQSIYGGRLIYKNGQWSIEATHGFNVYDGSENWVYQEPNTFRLAIPTGAKLATIPKNCNMFVPSLSGADNTIFFGSANMVITSAYFNGDVNAFKTFLSNNNLQICYELATPVIIPLTSSARIKTLSGVNNIFSNTGDSTLKYFTNDADGIVSIHEALSGNNEPTQIDTLWSGDSTSGTANLTHPYTDYDLLIMKAYNTNYAAWLTSAFYTKSLALNTQIVVCNGSITNNNRRVTGMFTSSTAFQIVTADGGTSLVEIVGYKFGTGYAVQPVIYSEAEREIGVWKDGKPLYEKTVTNIALTHNSWTTIFDGSSIGANIIEYEGKIGIQGNSIPYCQLDYFRGSSEFACSSVANGNKLQVLSNIVSPETVLYATIRYTKTTDVAGSGHWTPQDVPSVHYSTDEHIVGEWIDGKTIYERTYTFTAPSSNAFSREDLGILMSGISNAWIDVQNSFATNSSMCTNAAFYDGNSTKPDQFGGYLNFLQTNLAFDYRVGSDLYSSNIVLTIRYTKSS